MLSSPARYFVLLLLCAAIAVLLSSLTLPARLRSEEAPPAKQSSSAKANGSPKKSVPAAESKKTVERERAAAPTNPLRSRLRSLPPDAVIVIGEQANQALDLVPKAVILTPEKYQSLVDQIEKLKKEIENQKNENAVPPTRCVLRGKVESGAVRLTAEFAGTAERANTLVSLACPQAGASSAQTDGRMALIRRSGSGGFLVRIDKAGEYHVQLDLLVPLATREGNGRGFELTLPRAVITQLELDLPANCTDVRVGGQLLKDLQLPGLELKNKHLSGNPGLGPVDKLDLSWKEVHPSIGEPVRTAEGRIQARLDAAGLTTEADLLLTAEGAATTIWRLLVPRNAAIKVLPSDKEGRIEHRIETADQKFASLRTIHLKQARSEPLHVYVKLPLLAVRPGKAMPIGPFFVLDAARQTGTVLVRNQVRNLHLEYRAHGDMQLRRQEVEDSKDESPATVATLVYSDIPMIEKPEGTTGPKSLSWLDVVAEKALAQVRMRVSHTLTLRPQRAEDVKPADSRPWAWEIRTAVTPAPGTKWADVEQLKILVPPEWEPLDENVSVIAAGNSRYAIIPPFFLRETAAQPQRLEGRYKGSYKAEEHAVLELPRPQGTMESCELKIEAPADVEVGLNNADKVNLELSRQVRPNEQTWHCRGAPPDGQRIEVSWRPYRPELRVLSVVDLTLTSDRGDVRHELRLRLPPTPPPFVTLRVPPAIGDDLQIQDDRGRELRTVSTGPPQTRRLPVPAKDGGKEWRLLLHYRTRLREKDRTLRAGEPFVAPLVALEQATSGDLKVRLWSEPGFLPRAANPHWEESGIEEVKDRALPVLVLHTTKLDAPLRLILHKQAVGFSALVERVLMRVQLHEGGAQGWQVHFQLRQLADDHLDVLMPGPMAARDAQFFFNGQKVTPVFINDEGDNIVRLHLPRLERAGSVSNGPTAANVSGSSPAPYQLEVSFQMPPGRSGASPLHTTLQPPQIRGATAAPICWQVSVPANCVLLAPESAAGVERVWTRRGWLLAANLVLLPELRHEDEPAALVCWQEQSAPIVLTHAPQRGWLLACSLGLLFAGWGLYWSARPQANDGGRLAVWFWPLLALLTLAAAVAALFRPTLLCAIVYGCEPGAVVLLAVLGLQWLMHQRYRRQIVFLPSFSRSRPGSSLSRKNSSHRPKSSEPSTVDAPPPNLG